MTGREGFAVDPRAPYDLANFTLLAAEGVPRQYKDLAGH